MTRSTTLKRQEHERAWLAALYARWTVQEEQANVNYLRLAEELGATAAPFLKATHTYREIGALITRLVYERGRRAFWTLAIPQDEAMRRLTEHQHNEIAAMSTPSQPEPVSELVASVGDEADSPFAPLQKLKGRDEEEALVAAARQYASRKDIMAATVKQLEAAGIEVKRDAFTFKTDPQLEAVSLVLPVIDRQRKMNEYLEERWTRLKDQLSPLNQQIEELKAENKGLRRVVDRLQNATVTEEQRVIASR